MQQVRIETGGHADRLRKHRRVAVGGHAVQSFTPPVVRRDAQPRDRWRGMHHLWGLFLERHARHEVIDASLEGQRRIAERQRRLGEG
jgi:hypothetical protein